MDDPKASNPSWRISMSIIYPNNKYKYYTIYQTTNLLNKKQYIGYHKTNSFSSYKTKNYLGSSRTLQKDVKQLGRENFIREFLFIFDNENDMLNKEHELVNKSIWKNDMYYNKTPGGGNPPTLFGEDSPTKRKDVRKKISISNTGKIPSKETREKISKSLKGKKRGVNHPNVKLNEENVIEIVNLWNTGSYKYDDLEKKFNVSHSCIGSILTRRSWIHITKNLTIKNKKHHRTTNPPLGENSTNVKLTNEQVFQIKYHDPRLHQWGGVAQIAKECGVTYQTIDNIKHGRAWNHI